MHLFFLNAIFFFFFYNVITRLSSEPSKCLLLTLHFWTLFKLRKNSWSAAERSGLRLRTLKPPWESCQTSAAWKGSCCEACPCMEKRTSSLLLDWSVYCWCLYIQDLYEGHHEQNSQLSTIASHVTTLKVKVCTNTALVFFSLWWDTFFHFVYFLRFLATTAWCTSTVTKVLFGTQWWAAELKHLGSKLWRGT